MRQGRRGQKPLLILRAPEPVLCSHRWRAVVIDFCPSNPDPCPLSLSVCVCVRAAAPCLFPQMLSITLLCVCAFGYVSARSDSGNFLDDKWLTGRWDRFRDVSNMHVSSLLSHVYSSIPHFLPMPRCVFFFLLLLFLVMRCSFSPRVHGRRVTGSVVRFVILHPDSCL